MHFLALDLGTTHIKAAVVDHNGQTKAVHQVASQADRTSQGFAYSPERFWQAAVHVVQRVWNEASVPIAALGLTGMAESGLLLDARTLKPRSSIIPWFDTGSQTELGVVSKLQDPHERFMQTGLRLSPKYGLLKMLWLKRQGVELQNSMWLSAMDYIALRLTGITATDPTLAARSYLYSLSTDAWDYNFIDHCSLPVKFPDVMPSGTPLGECIGEDPLAFLKGVPVSIGGHDHIVASVTVGGLCSGGVLNSVGTAEVLLGTEKKALLTEEHYTSGLSFGPHVLPGFNCWMGGLSDAGGSIEWIRSILSESQLTYEQIEEMLAGAPAEPSGIMYHPFLSGSGAPWPEPSARGAFIGLRRHHTRADLVKAVFEGISMAMEMIRREAQKLTSGAVDPVLVVGGGAKNHFWLQTKADIFGSPLTVLEVQEAALVGAALLAGVGNGLISFDDVQHRADGLQSEIVTPRDWLHEQYEWFLSEGFVGLQQPLREYYRKIVRRDGRDI